MSGEKTRYSDEELEEFKQLINQKIEVARSELKYYQNQIQKKDEHAEGESDHKFNSLEEGSLHNEKEYLTSMASRQMQFITNLENALVRIKNKNYGVCRVTNKLIPKERLKAVPHATTSMEGKLMEKNNPKGQSN